MMYANRINQSSCSLTTNEILQIQVGDAHLFLALSLLGSERCVTRSPLVHRSMMYLKLQDPHHARKDHASRDVVPRRRGITASQTSAPKPKEERWADNPAPRHQSAPLDDPVGYVFSAICQFFAQNRVMAVSTVDCRYAALLRF